MNTLKPDDIIDKLNIPKLIAWCDYYSLGSPISITIDTNFDWPAAIDLSDIKRPRMILNPVVMKVKLWYTDTQMFVDLFHEIEHYFEEWELKATESWRTIWKKRNKRLDDAWIRWKTMHKTENILRDCFVDDQVILPSKAPVLKNDLEKMFKNSLYKWTDYEKEPLHVQLMNAIWREYRLPWERCKLDPKVRVILERLKRNWSLKDATTWSLWKRLENIWENIEPQVMRLFEEDLKNHHEQKDKPWEWMPQAWSLWQPKPGEGQGSNEPQQWDNQNKWNEDWDKPKAPDWNPQNPNPGNDGKNWEPSEWQKPWETQPQWSPSWNPQWSNDLDPWKDSKNWEPSKWQKPWETPQWSPQSDNTSSTSSSWAQSPSIPDSKNAPEKKTKKPLQSTKLESLIDKMRKKLEEIRKWKPIKKEDGKPEDESPPNGDVKDDKGRNNNWTEWEKGDDKWENKPWTAWDGESTDELTGQNPFDSYYKDRSELSKLLENVLWKENIEKLEHAVSQNKWKKVISKTREELELDKRVKNMWIDPRDEVKFKEHLKNLEKYDSFLKQLETLTNPVTWEFVMTEIEELFEKIKSHRLKPKYKSRGPVDMDRGARLDWASLADWIADLESWNLDPYMFEEDYREEKEDMRTWNFDLTLVTDWSQSMSLNGKNPQQKIACLLIFEALKRLHDKLADAVYEMKSPIEFSTSWIMFKWWKSIVDLKKKSSDFTDKDRIDCFNKLDYCNWWDTNDYDAIDRLITEMSMKDDEYIKDIKSWKIKNIVVVLTDWDSTNAALLKKKLETLRSYGVIVYAIWITNDWQAVVENYFSKDISQGYWIVCDDVEMLSISLEKILFEHLEKL
ncbi:MAG: hypothetical protein ACD_3C00108G0003 [uncultured bacterium (gcode 4)]|uniref:VWFA domain-containing protein n=1 Tax=uncultured bacterium (gcode 4) TaxID=1234023 RepID=K2GXD5_9BACT|nr:MAG: hypothetical protein ACD_3C00108G0003 [uncultured bacterium (gcode 4)]